MIEYIPTKKRDGLIANVNGDTYNRFYLYKDIVCIERWNPNSIHLSDDFHNRIGCKLVKTWEYKTYDTDNYGKKWYSGGDTTREIWDISEFMETMGVMPTHIDMENPSYDIIDFMNNR